MLTKQQSTGLHGSVPAASMMKEVDRKLAPTRKTWSRMKICLTRATFLSRTLMKTMMRLVEAQTGAHLSQTQMMATSRQDWTTKMKSRLRQRLTIVKKKRPKRDLLFFILGRAL